MGYMCEATCREVFQDGSQDTFFRACFGTEIRSPCGRWTCLIEICLDWLSVVTVAAVGRIAQPCIRFEHTSVTLRIDQSKVAVGSTSHCVLLISSLQVNISHCVASVPLFMALRAREGPSTSQVEGMRGKESWEQECRCLYCLCQKRLNR